HFYARKTNSLVPGVRRVLANRPFRLLLVVYMIASVTGAIPGIFIPFYTQYVLGLESWAFWFSVFIFAYFLSGFVSIPGWLWAARRFGKKGTWIASFVLGISASLSLFFLPDLVTGRDAILPMLGILVWAGAGFGAGMFLNPSIQADVIDYDELHTGRRREAQFGAMWAIITKFAVIPSASVPLALLATVGYQPNVPQSEEVRLMIRGIFGLAPAAFSALAMVFAFRFPVTERVHRAILEGLDAHRRGEHAVDPLTGAALPPPHARGVDEETGWFLDHFSPAELRRGLRTGFGHVVRAASWKAAASFGLAGGAFLAVTSALGDLATKPGPLVVVAVVAGGLAFAAFAFHAARIGPARRLRDGAASPDEVERHLALHARQAPPVRPGP
ncbi:MAG: MFS transporter, partial [Myxococcota bacterium]|nr:MFS transporter [Myxococcota bacterium]